jgi:DNA-binding NtrC family response regulator
VRELSMVVQRAAVLSQGDVIEATELQLDPPRSWRADALGRGLTLAELEQQYIEETLARFDGHRGRAAEALGIDPKTLYNKLGPDKKPQAVRAGRRPRVRPCGPPGAILSGTRRSWSRTRR